MIKDEVIVKIKDALDSFKRKFDSWILNIVE